MHISWGYSLCVHWLFINVYNTVFCVHVNTVSKILCTLAFYAHLLFRWLQKTRDIQLKRMEWIVHAKFIPLTWSKVTVVPKLVEQNVARHVSCFLPKEGWAWVLSTRSWGKISPTLAPEFTSKLNNVLGRPGGCPNFIEVVFTDGVGGVSGVGGVRGGQ